MSKKLSPVVLAISNYKVKSGVLQLTLGISLVISLLCASIILIVYYGKLTFLQHDIENRLRDNAASGIQYTMGNRTGMSFNTLSSIDLFGDGNDSVELVRQPWGIFELFKARATQGNHYCEKAALIAAIPSDVGLAAMYIPDNNAPLYLVGNTSIHGTVYGPDRKFAPGYIDGKGYEKSKLFDGDLKKSERLIPPLDTTLLIEMRSLLLNRESSYRLTEVDRMPIDSMVSFGEASTARYYSNQSIDIDDSISGNVIIQSAIKIRIGARAVLTDVIIVAPDVDIDNEFKGTVQCFAERSIVVGASCVLKYPSALVLCGASRDSTIIIRHDAIVEGAVVIPGHDQTIGSRAVFKLEKNATFHGMAYVNAGADIQGRIWGHITARSFQTNLNGAVYGNNLMNAEIDGTKRSPAMPATLLWGHTKELVIAKWLE